jgi:hypothetical protein
VIICRFYLRIFFNSRIFLSVLLAVSGFLGAMEEKPKIMANEALAGTKVKSNVSSLKLLCLDRIANPIVSRSIAEIKKTKEDATFQIKGCLSGVNDDNVIDTLNKIEIEFNSVDNKSSEIYDNISQIDKVILNARSADKDNIFGKSNLPTCLLKIIQNLCVMRIVHSCGLMKNEFDFMKNSWFLEPDAVPAAISVHLRGGLRDELVKHFEKTMQVPELGPSGGTIDQTRSLVVAIVKEKLTSYEGVCALKTYAENLQSTRKRLNQVLIDDINKIHDTLTIARYLIESKETDEVLPGK